MESRNISLPSGHSMPLLGLGTYDVSKNVSDMKVALETAFDSGYRLIDTAYIYRNESLIGEALKEIFDSGKIKREEVFVTSKYNSDAIFSQPKGDKSDFEHHDHVQTWKWMEELVDEGLVRSIGLSNFNSKQIAAVEAAARIPISNLQVECHVYLTQVKLHQFCQQHGITFTSYCTLGAAGYGPASIPFLPVLIKDPVVVGIANKHNKTPAQVLLRFMIERRIAVIPKSSSPSRIRENSQIFDFTLSPDEMNQLHQLNRNFRLFGDSSEKGYGEHPDYPFHEEF